MQYRKGPTGAVEVGFVMPEGPAYRAGLRRGDLIKEVRAQGGTPVAATEEAISGATPGVPHQLALEGGQFRSVTPEVATQKLRTEFCEAQRGAGTRIQVMNPGKSSSEFVEFPGRRVAGRSN